MVEAVTPGNITERMEVIASIREALARGSINETDPAYLIATALEMNLRAVEELPKKITTASQAALGVIDAAAKNAVIKATAEAGTKTETVTAAITVAATQAAGEATKKGIEQAKRLITNEQDNRLMSGIATGSFICLIGFAAAYQAGRLNAEGYIVNPSGIFGLIWNCPAGYPIIILVLAAIAGFLFRFTGK